jgi:putative transposase
VGDEEHRLQVAASRYRLIAEAAETSEGVTAAIKQAAARSYVDLSGCEVMFDERTLWRYLQAYRSDGLLGLMPKERKDRGQLRALSPEVLRKAVELRQQNDERPTKTIIDILVRQKEVAPGTLKRPTLDRHLNLLGESRRQRRQLGKTTYRQVKTEAPFELVIADFHHGPYVRVGDDGKARRALLLAFIDHFSRYIVEARYYLHEDFAALRFGLRLVLLVYGLFLKLYIDNGPSFQSARLHGACNHEAIDIEVVHSKPYVSEGRGACERFNRTCKEQFENEACCRDELLTLDELNGYLEAWLSERYHRDVHSELGQSPAERFRSVPPQLRPAPPAELLDELLRLRQKRTVHKKWSTVELGGVRYVVSPTLRGRKVQALYDPFEPSYLLIEHDGRIIERAYPQKPGQAPPEPPPRPQADEQTDYLALLRADHEARVRAELSALRLQPLPPQPELSLVELVGLMQGCRGAVLSDAERSEVSACFRKLRPIEPEAARAALDSATRRLGHALHVRVYLDALQSQLVRQRTKKKKGKTTL